MNHVEGQLMMSKTYDNGEAIIWNMLTEQRQSTSKSAETSMDILDK